MAKKKDEFEIIEITEREEIIEKVMLFLEKYSYSTIYEVAQGLGINDFAAYQALETLKNRGEVESEWIEDLSRRIEREAEEHIYQLRKEEY